MEEPIISGVTHDSTEAKVTIFGVPDRPGISATLFEPLAASNVNVDMIVQNTAENGLTDISFTVAKTDAADAQRACDAVREELGAQKVTADAGIGRVTLVGAGMKSHPGVTAQMFETLSSHGINIEMISTSSIRISCVLRANRVEEAVRHLHTAFGLDSA